MRLKRHFVAWAKSEAALRRMSIYDFLELVARSFRGYAVDGYDDKPGHRLRFRCLTCERNTPAQHAGTARAERAAGKAAKK